MNDEPGLTIREAAACDAAAMAGIKVDTWRVAYRGIISDEYLDALSYAEVEGRFRNVISVPGPGEQFMVAEAGGKVIGFVIFGPERAVAAENRGEVYAVYVRPEHHGRGVGRKLMVAAACRLMEQGMRSLTVWTLDQARSRHFYERLGGRMASSKTAHIGGAGYVHVAYCWSDMRLCFEP